MSAQTVPQLPVLVTVPEAGRMLGVAPKTVRRLVRTGVLPARRFGANGYIRIALDDLERLLEPTAAA